MKNNDKNTQKNGNEKEMFMHTNQANEQEEACNNDINDMEQVEIKWKNDPLMNIIMDAVKEIEKQDPDDFQLNIVQKCKVDYAIEKLKEWGNCEIEVDLNPVWQNAYIMACYNTLAFNGRKEIEEFIEILMQCTAVGVDEAGDKIGFQLTIPGVYEK